MNEPEEPNVKPVAAAPATAIPMAAIVTIALYALGMAGASILLLVGVDALALVAGWDAGTWSAAAAAVSGALAVGFVLVRRPRHLLPEPGTLLALLSATTALAALISPLAMRGAAAIQHAIWPLLGGTAAGRWLLDIALAVSLLALPAAFFAGMPGAFSRLLGAHRPLANAGLTLGATFAGMALGALLGGTVLLPVVGTRGSLFLGVALLGLATGGIILMRRAGIEAAGSLGALLGGDRDGEADSRQRAGGSGGATGGSLSRRAGGLAAFALGLIGWGMLVCWSRVVGLIAGPTEPVGASVAAVFLAGLSVGAFAVLALPVRRPGATLSTVLACGAVVIAATSFFVTRAAVLYLDLVASAPGGGIFSIAGVVIGIVLVLPAAVALGAGLTVLLSIPDGESVAPFALGAPRWGVMILLGAAAGDVLFRLVLVPEFGLRRSLSAAAATALLAAIVVLRSAREVTSAGRNSGTLTLTGLLLVVAAFPASWEPRLVASASYRYGARGVERLGSVQDYIAARRTTTPIYYREGRTATVMVERRIQAAADGKAIEALQLTNDGRVVAGNLADLRTQILQAHLPLLLHGEVLDVLLAGYSTGVTAGSILTHPIERLVAVEQEPALFEPEIEAVFGPYNNRPLDDPRLFRVAASPRAWLGVDHGRYDVILLQAPAPWLPSDAALLTAEGYEKMKARLQPGGLVAQRIALSTVNAIGAGSILRTFAASFEEVLLFQISPEDLLLIGSSSPMHLDNARMRSQIAARDEVVGDLSRALNVDANELLIALRLGGKALRDLVGAGPINRDNHSTVSLEALNDMRIHDNDVLLGALDAAGHDALLDVLVNYGEDTDEEATFLYGLAKTYLGLATDPDRAESIARRLSSLGATARAGWVRGEALLQQADFEGAIRAWEGILEVEPDYLDALFSLGIFYLDRRDYFAADRFLSRAARNHPEASIVLYHHGRNLFYLERFAEAIDSLERARLTAGTPGRYPLTDYLLGVAALRLKRSAEAETYLKTYLKWAYAQKNLTVLEVEAHGRLAEVYEQQGEPMKGRKERERALRLQIEMREFARQQPSSGESQGRGGLVLPNPAADPPAGETPRGDQASPSEAGGKAE